MKRLLSVLRPRALLVLAVLLPAGRSLAQEEEEGPVFGAKQRSEFFRINAIHGGLSFRSMYSNTTIGVPTGASSQSTVWSLQEMVDLGTTGHIVHPNILEFHVGGGIGLEQDSVSDSSGNTGTDSTIYTWDVGATLLRNQDLTLSAYTQRIQSLVNQPFGETFNSTDTSYGGTLDWKSKALPTTVTAYRTENVQTSLSGQQDFSVTENVLEWHTGVPLGEHQALDWNYAYISTDQTAGSGTTGSSVSTSLQTEALSHYINFGPSYTWNLNSSVVLSQAADPFSQDSLLWNEMLRIRHTQNLETWYSYSLDQESRPDLSQQTQTAMVSLQHRLYKSLTTHGSFRYTELDIADQSNTQTEVAEVDWDYSKKVPYGMLEANLGLSYSQQNATARTQDLPVVNQPLTFSGPVPTVLQQRDILPTSIVLHNARGFIFSPISDYRVFDRGTFLEIERLPTSLNIHDGDTVLMDYLLAPEPANSTTTNVLSTGLRYDINQGLLAGLAPFVEFYMQDQSFSASGPTLLQADQVQDVRAGTEYRRGDLMLRGEYQVHDSTLEPFTALRFLGRWGWRFGIDSSLQFQGTYENYNFSLAGNQTTALSAAASLRHQFSQELHGSASVDWLNTQDSLAGQTQGLEEQVELSWRHRQVQVFMQFRNASINSDFLDQNFQLFMLGIRREF